MEHERFRSLNLEELTYLENEFVQYLVLQGIMPNDWEDIKGSNASKRDQIISDFSQMIWTGALGNVRYVDVLGEGIMIGFHFQLEQVVCVVLEQTEGQPIDFRNDSLESNFAGLPEKSWKVFSLSKSYKQTKEIELYEVLQKGGVLSDGTLYKKLCLLL